MGADSRGAVPLENLDLLDSEVHHLRQDVREYRDEAKGLALRVGSLEVRIEGQTKVLERVEGTVKHARNVVATLIVGLLLALVGMALQGCAPVQVRPRQTVLSEPVAGAVVALLERGAGIKAPDAITLPGGRVIYLRNADDECLQAHEAVHVRQQMDMGVEKWGAVYLHELCREGGGYEKHPLEQEPRAAQMACEAARARQERPP